MCEILKAKSGHNRDNFEIYYPLLALKRKTFQKSVLTISVLLLKDYY